MTMNIYVGNLSYDTTEERLNDLFAAHGTVLSAKVIRDQYTGRSRGFGFVEMEDRDEATKAIDELNEHEVDGRAIKVNEARPKRGGQGERRSRW